MLTLYLVVDGGWGDWGPWSSDCPTDCLQERKKGGGGYGRERVLIPLRREMEMTAEEIKLSKIFVVRIDINYSVRVSFWVSMLLLTFHIIERDPAQEP